MCRLPIGPIGTYLSLRDINWGPAVEQAAGASYNRWIVHNGRDRQMLMAMAQQVRYRDISVVQTSFDTPRHQWNPNKVPPQELTTVLDQLIINGA